MEKKKKGRGEKRARSFERLMDITIISIRWEWLWKRKKSKVLLSLLQLLNNWINVYCSMAYIRFDCLFLLLLLDFHIERSLNFHILWTLTFYVFIINTFMIPTKATNLEWLNLYCWTTSTENAKLPREISNAIWNGWSF